MKKREYKEWEPTNGHRERPKDLWEQMIKSKVIEEGGGEEEDGYTKGNNQTEGTQIESE